VDEEHRYKIKQYGCALDEPTNTFRLELTLERVPSQTPLREIENIPRPSQMDDWGIFEKLEAELIKQKEGHQGFLEWKMRNEEEKVDREHWRRAREFTASLSLTNGGSGAEAGGNLGVIRDRRGLPPLPPFC
jgi:hypothetical protein